jgi:hypothetical protein
MRLLSRRRKRKTPHAGIFLSAATRFGVSWLSRCAGKCPNSLSLSLLFAHFSALHNIHEAPHYAAVLKYLPACDASRLLRLESSRIALFFGRLGLRHCSLALGLLYAQRYIKTMLVSMHTYISK